MASLDIVIPLHNSRDNVLQLISRLNSWSETINIELNVIFVEDGSLNSSEEIINSAIKKFQAKYIQLLRNYGQHTATAIGLGYCSSDLVVTLDDDLQHDPFEIEKLLAHQRKTNSDLIYGRFLNKKHSLIRNSGSRILKFLFKMEGVDYTNVTSFRLMSNKLALQFRGMRKPIVFIEEYLVKNCENQSACYVTHNARESGNSSYSNRKLVRFGMKIILFHSSLLLKLVVRAGLIIALACFISGCYFIYKKIAFDSQMGFSALIVSIFFSTGILLVTLGIIGEYIRRIWIGQQELDAVLLAEKI